MTGSIDIMISGFQALHYKKKHTWLPEDVRVANVTRFRLVKILGLRQYFNDKQKETYDGGYGDIGVVSVYELIWDDKLNKMNDFDEWFRSLDFSPICEDEDDGDWEDGCELHILVKDLFEFIFEHDIRFIELM